MKVILISTTPPPMGGIAKWTQRMLAEELPDGWSIDLVDSGIVGKREPFGDNIKYNIVDEIKRWMRVWAHLIKECLKKDAPIVHACPIATRNSMIVNIVSACISILCKKKYIAHFRCTVPNLVKTKTQLILLKVLCKLSHRIIALNEQTSNFLKKNTCTSVVNIPNFVDLKETVTEKIINEKISTILYVGGVTKEKGCDDIIEVARLLPNINFRLVGKISSDILKMAEGLNNISFLGVLGKQDVFHEMNNADVFLFLSKFWGEGFSNAVAEAMASGLPCIVTNWAANADQIDHLYGGIVVGEDIVDDTVCAIKKMQDKSTRTSYSKYNIQKVFKQYSSRIIIRQYVDIYNNLLC